MGNNLTFIDYYLYLISSIGKRISLSLLLIDFVEKNTHFQLSFAFGKHYHSNERMFQTLFFTFDSSQFLNSYEFSQHNDVKNVRVTSFVTLVVS